MSRVAKAPIVYPASVDVTLDGEKISVKGPQGTLLQSINKLVRINKDKESNKLEFAPASKDPKAWAQAGTARAIVHNMVVGVTEGFTKTLELVGVGYRVQVNGKTVVLSLGYSHNIEYKLPENVQAEAPSNTSLILKSTDKQALGQVAAEIRAYRPPEPYKGKGVKYAGEFIMRKEAKKK